LSSQPLAFKDQQCNVSGLALSWLGYLGGLVYFTYVFASEGRWIGGLLFLVIVPSARWALFRFFPSISRFLGYGRVDDRLPASVDTALVTVTFYSFFSCPFCPIVLRRLEALQEAMGFTLEKIDVTLKPQILLSKGIRSVPVVEVGGNRLVGNATTAQLAELIAPAQSSRPSKAA
jgi:glutaredoxin